MSNLFRHTQIAVQRWSAMHRTIAANNFVAVRYLSQAGKSSPSANLAVRGGQNRLKPIDPIKPKPAGEPAYIPLVGKALNTGGQIGFGIVLAISAYFMYINYLTNPEFYKSLAVSREASKCAKEGSHGH